MPRNSEVELPSPLLPMLAVSGPLPSDARRWAFELKWDGARVLARLGESEVRLGSRRGNDVTVSYPELGDLARRVGRPAVLDGEVVALDQAGRPSFELLQRRMHVLDAARARRLAEEIPVAYLVFDVCYLDSTWLLDVPYAERRARLEDIGIDAEHAAVPGQITLAGAAALDFARDAGLEGIVAKRLDSPYRCGTRSPHWVKAKVRSVLDALVCGLVPGEGGRRGRPGSVVLGVPGPRGLEYAGKVGSGLSDAAVDDLLERLHPLRACAHPFAEAPGEPIPAALWLRPRLVVEVGYQGWTASGRLRSPTWRGLRDDLDPADIGPPGDRRTAGPGAGSAVAR